MLHTLDINSDMKWAVIRSLQAHDENGDELNFEYVCDLLTDLQENGFVAPAITEQDLQEAVDSAYEDGKIDGYNDGYDEAKDEYNDITEF